MYKKLTAFTFILSMLGCSYPMSLVGLDPDTADSNTPQWDTASADPSLQEAALKIISTNCSSCHDNGANAGGVSDITDVNHLVSARLLVPQSPDKSRLFTVIQSQAMPPDQALSANDIETLRQWILANKAQTPVVTPPPVTPPEVTPPTTTPPTPPVAGPEPTFKYISTEILGPKCAGCHRQGNAKGGYAFDTYTSVKKAVSLTKPTNSPVYREARDGSMPPRPRPQLSSAELNLLLDWIEAGALKN
nr:hypothetical protein CKG001_11970 [Bdellovibrio sp. CKG001]